MDGAINIACLQTRPYAEISEAIDEALPLAEAAVRSGAEMLFLPEYCGGLASDGARLIPPSAPSQAHPFVQAFQEFAAENSIWVLIGSVAVDGPVGKIINRGFLIDAAGQIAGQYDKIHMFDIQLSETEVYAESATVSAGSQAVIYETPFGKIGHTICYDLRFPHLYRALAQAGAEIICAPAAFTKKTGEAHWHILNRARAIENGCFVVSPCAIGAVPGGGESYGHSLVVSPWGEVVADGGTLPGVVSAQIDMKKVVEARGKIPSLSHDRPYEFVENRGAA